jgi:hypothetical protein
MARLKECSGSLAMTNALRASGQAIELPNPYAASGSKIHWFLATSPIWTAENLEAERQLTAQEMNVARRCRELQREIVSAFVGNNDQEIEFLVERRFWYRRGLKPVFSGQADFVVLIGDRALILDFKTGRIESDPVSDNLQIRSEAVLLKNEYPHLSEIEGCIIEPLVSWDPVRARYYEADLRQAEQHILSIVDESRWNLDRKAGTHCKWCPCRTHCLEAFQYIDAIHNGQPIKLYNPPRGEEGTRLYEKIGVAQKILLDIKETYREILKSDPTALPGYTIDEMGHQRRTVIDPEKFKLALAEYITAQEIDSMADFSVAQAEILFGERTQLKTKRLKEEFRKLTEEAVSIDHVEPSIRKLTKRERELKALKE